jgi:hypothetical protein
MYYLNRLNRITLAVDESVLVHLFKHQLTAQLYAAEFYPIQGSNVWENRLTGELISIIKCVDNPNTLNNQY